MLGKLNFDWDIVKTPGDDYPNTIYKCDNIQNTKVLMVINICFSDIIDKNIKKQIACVNVFIEGKSGKDITKGTFGSIGYDAQFMIEKKEQIDNEKQRDKLYTNEKLKSCYIQYIIVDELPNINWHRFTYMGFIDENGFGIDNKHIHS